jgi:3-oxoacyl-[acyl-carrier-protein] synthase II
VSIGQIINHDWLMACQLQLADTVASDVSGTPGDKNFHFLLMDKLISRILMLFKMVDSRIVITGLGLTSPIGDSLPEMRTNLLEGKARVDRIPMRYMDEVLAGVCRYDPLKYQKKKEVRNGTRAGSIAIFCANEAIQESKLDWENVQKDRVGVYVGTTEHGNVETENEIHNISQFDYDTKFWSHHHNPRTVANNPAGEITINLGITGPHYSIGAACAAGNAGLIQGLQMLRLGEVDIALAGGVSESIHTFGIFAGFKSQGALATHEDPNKASRPFDLDRNGIVVSEGGCLYVLERLEDAQARGANIIAEVVGYSINSDATDYVLPNPERQVECMRKALAKAGMAPGDIQIVNTHATSTPQGDIQECTAIREIFGDCPDTFVNNTKSYIGHAMGAAGALELAGNLPSFEDGMIHPTINVDRLDPQCELSNLVINQPRELGNIVAILNNSFGMLGINSSLVVKRFDAG